MLEPYQTLQSKTMIKKDEVLKVITKHLPFITHDMSFGFNTPELKYHFITGYSSYEAEIPMFNFPIYYINNKHEKVVFIDIRTYCIAPKESDVTLRSIVRDIVSVNFLILIAYFNFLGMETNNTHSKIISLYKSTMLYTCTAYAKLISTFLNRIVKLNANPLLQYKIEVAGFIYGYTLYLSNNDFEERLEELEALFIKHAKLIIPYDKTIFTPIFDSLIEVVKKYNTLKGIPLLEELLKVCLEDSSKNFANVTPLLNMLSGSWWGPGNNETMFCSIESYPTFLIMIYISTKYPNFNKTKFNSFIDLNKNSIKPKEIVSILDGIIKDERIEIL